MASKEVLNRKIQLLEKEISDLKAEKGVIIRKAGKVVRELRAGNQDLLRLSMNIEEHPENYHGPCHCQMCQSYQDERVSEDR